MKPAQQAQNQRAMMMVGFLAFLVLANFIVRFLGYGSATVVNTPAPPTGPGTTSTASGNTAVASVAATNPVEDLAGALQKTQALLKELPPVLKISQASETCPEVRRNPFRWDLQIEFPGSATGGVQLASGPAIPTVFPRLLGMFTVRGETKCLLGLGNKAYLLASDSQFYGLPFRVSEIKKDSLTVAFAGGFKKELTRERDPFDKISQAVGILKNPQVWDYPLAGVAQTASQAGKIKGRENLK